MATKAEYLSALDSKVLWRGAEVEDTGVRDSTAGAWRLYNVPVVVKLPNGTVQGAKQGFYVYNLGGQDEAAYAASQERKDPSLFRQQLDAYLASQLSATILKITVDSVNEDHEFAIVTAYILSAGPPATVGTKRFFVAKDGANAVRYEFTG